MKSYKQWKLINESFFPGMTLGVTTPQALGGLQSNVPLSEKKKMSGKVIADDEDLADDHEDDAEEGDHKEPDGDEGDCSCKKKFAKKKCNKMMKKKMKKMEDDDFDADDKDSGEEDDVNDVETPDSDGKGDNDDDDGEEDGGNDKGGDDKDDDESGDDDDGAKYGFMKDKKKKKKMKKMEEQFWDDIKGYHVPKNSEESEQEFFDSLARQYGNPQKERYDSGIQGDGINEDLLLTPDQVELINAMPNPGEVGYSPNQRLGGFSASEQPELETLPYGESYEESVEDSGDFEVLCKYFTEDVARNLIEKKRSR